MTLDVYRLDDDTKIILAKKLIEKLEKSFYYLMLSHTNFSNADLDLRYCVNDLVTLLLDNKRNIDEIAITLDKIVKKYDQQEVTNKFLNDISDSLLFARNIGNIKIADPHNNDNLLF